MHNTFTRENEILDAFMRTPDNLKVQMKAMEVAGADISLDVLKARSQQYNRGTRQVSVPWDEVESFMADLIIKVNRWKELHEQGEAVTVDDVVNSTLSTIILFDSLMFSHYLEH